MLISPSVCEVSGFAQSINQLVFLQIIQGVGSAMMIPGSLAIINVTFKESERGQAIGLWSGYSAGLGAFGSVIGGFLTQQISWRAIFLINIPLALIVLLITAKYVFESRNPTKDPLDIWGTIAIALALLGFTFSLVQGGVIGFTNPFILISFFLAFSSFVGFVLIERKVKSPIVPLSIFKSPLVRGANIVTLFLYFALFGIFFFLALNFQQVQGYSPTMAGIASLPPILLITFLSGYGGKISDKFGPRIPMTLGAIIVGTGFLLLTFTTESANYFLQFLPGLVLFGGGMALVIPSLTKAALSVETKHSGAASGINNAVSRTAALLAIAMLGAIAVALFTPQLKENLAATNLNSKRD